MRDRIAQKLELLMKGNFPRIDPALITPTAMIKDLGIDSLDFVEFVYHIESEFGIEVASDALMTIKTVQDVIDLVYHCQTVELGHD